MRERELSGYILLFGCWLWSSNMCIHSLQLVGNRHVQLRAAFRLLFILYLWLISLHHHITAKEKHFWEPANNSKLWFPNPVSNYNTSEGFPQASMQRNRTCISSFTRLPSSFRNHSAALCKKLLDEILFSITLMYIKSYSTAANGITGVQNFQKWVRFTKF